MFRPVQSLACELKTNNTKHVEQNLLLYCQKRQAYLFPQSVKMRNFCSGPISVDPICPQPSISHPPQAAMATSSARSAASSFGATVLYTGVCKINTHPTCGQCRTPPLPLMSMFTDMGNVSAIGLSNKQSLLLAVVGCLGVNFEIRGAGSGHQKR